MTLSRVLTEEEERILVDERRSLAELRVVLERCNLEDEDAESFEASIRQLDELFLLVVAGEFNSGKSAFVNAIIGERLLEEGVTPTTSRVTLLQHGDALARIPSSDAYETVFAPIDVLRRVHIVDTPGTNAIHREHEAVTKQFLPRSDLILFVTSADRPFTESERSFLEGIRSWGKKVVIVINKVDLLASDGDVDEVRRFVESGAAELLGTQARVFSVSTKEAVAAKSADDVDALERSGFVELERFLVATLDDRQRVRLKLENPLGVGESLADKYSGIAAAELELLREDLEMLGKLDNHLELYERDQHRDFRFRLSNIDNALLDFESRGARFFEETLRLGRIVDLVNKARIQLEFENNVVGDLPQVVEKRTDEVIDWMVTSEREQWEALMAHLDERGRAHEHELIGKLPATFVQDREKLLGTVGDAAKRAIDGYDRKIESARLAQSVQNAVASTAVLEVSALGLGALVSALATTTAVDVTGILAAGALSVVGLLVLPAKRRKAKAELNRKVGELREKLMGSLERQFESELKLSLARIREAIAPYTRFVRSEKERLTANRTGLEASKSALQALSARISAAE